MFKYYLFVHDINRLVGFHMKNKKLLILSIIGSLLLVSIAIASSYAYFVANVSGNKDTNNVVVTNGVMALEYKDGDEITLANAIPGSSVSKTFTVKNTGNVSTNYTIYFSELSNKFVDKTDLVYTLTSSDGGKNVAQTQVPSTNEAMVSNYAIDAGKTHTYTLTITFLNKDENQNDNMGVTFSTKVSINETKEYVEPEYTDNVIAEAPELAQGMIPVKFDASGNVIVADTHAKWYDYSNHEWANAVLVNCADSSIKSKYFDSNNKVLASAVGKTISMDEIMQMYVYIPRYKYQLFNAEDGTSNPQAINITFESKTTSKSTGSRNGEWLTHPAFTFGDKELAGIWVGKFETSNTSELPKIVPNVSSLRNMKVSAQFNTSRLMTTTLASTYGTSTNDDSHMMKNMEWGAVAYLSSSIYGRYTNASTCIESGCEVWINNNLSFTTGCAGSIVSASEESTCNAWNTATGVNASTTGNIYGIYDMSGGAVEYVMGNYNDTIKNAGFSSMPEAKYYDKYTGTDSYSDFTKYHLGDATKETLKAKSTGQNAWYQDYSYAVYSSRPWGDRGGCYYGFTGAGVVSFSYNDGNSKSNYSFRVVLGAL